MLIFRATGADILQHIKSAYFLRAYYKTLEVEFPEDVGCVAGV